MNLRLALKLEDNKERREKEVLFASLPPRWLELIAHCSHFPSRDFLAQFPVNLNFDLTKQPLLADKLINHVDYDDIQNVKHYLQQQQMLLQPPVVCWFGSGPAFTIENIIPIKWLSELNFNHDFCLYFAESDFSRGVICSEYLGYLEADRITNNRESVYEIMSFDNR